MIRHHLSSLSPLRGVSFRFSFSLYFEPNLTNCDCDNSQSRFYMIVLSFSLSLSRLHSCPIWVPIQYRGNSSFFQHLKKIVSHHFFSSLDCAHECLFNIATTHLLPTLAKDSFASLFLFSILSYDLPVWKMSMVPFSNSLHNFY